MKVRIACIALALAMVIGMFWTIDTCQNFLKTTDTIQSLNEEVKGDLSQNAKVVPEIERAEIQLLVVEETVEKIEVTVQETAENIEPTEEQIVEEYYEEYFGENITFDGKYISDGEVMPYALYIPSTIDETKKTPLIVWLHGSGEVGAGEKTFFNSGLLETMNNWKLDGFNAYVICPQLVGNWNTGRWNKEATRTNLQELLDKFMNEHNIDSEQVIIVGHSLGGQGALYMAHELPEYFSRCVVLSGYDSGIDISEITIPTIGFVGTSYAGEDGNSISYMKNSLAEVFGIQNVFSIETSHGAVPKTAFNLDSDADSRSDLVEWMLGEFEF